MCCSPAAPARTATGPTRDSGPSFGRTCSSALMRVRDARCSSATDQRPVAQRSPTRRIASLRSPSYTTALDASRRACRSVHAASSSSPLVSRLARSSGVRLAAGTPAVVGSTGGSGGTRSSLIGPDSSIGLGRSLADRMTAMYVDGLSFLEDEREAWRPYEALESVSDASLDVPVDGGAWMDGARPHRPHGRVAGAGPHGRPRARRRRDVAVEGAGRRRLGCPRRRDQRRPDRRVAVPAARRGPPTAVDRPGRAPRLPHGGARESLDQAHRTIRTSSPARRSSTTRSTWRISRRC